MEIRTLRKVQGKAAESNSSVTYPLAVQLPKRGMQCEGLLIESYLLSGVTTVEQATSLIAIDEFTSKFKNAYEANGSNSVNVSPASTTVTTNGYCQRFLPACGNCVGATGPATDGQGSVTIGLLRLRIARTDGAGTSAVAT